MNLTPYRDLSPAALRERIGELAAEVARLEAAGIRFRSAPQRRASHASVYGHDPDGNVLELLEVTDDSHPFSFATLGPGRDGRP